MVLAFHFSTFFGNLQGPWKALRTVFVAGWTGVDLFFVLSGCLITGILLDERGTGGYFRRFYIRRALRIFPVYYLMLGLTFTLLRPWLLPPEGVPALATGAYLINFSNWLSVNQTETPALTHFWSLAVEEQFYLCWPLAVLWLDRKVLVRLIGVVIVLAPVVRFLILSSAGDPEWLKRMASTLTPSRADGLAFGALVAVILRHPQVAVRLMGYSTASIACVGGGLALWFGLKSRLHLESAGTLALLYSVLGVGYGLLVLRAIWKSGGSELALRVLRKPLLRQAGRYSYAAYVFHLPVLDVMEQGMARLGWGARPEMALIWFVGSFVVTFGLARISWQLMEAPILKWKDVFAPRLG